MLLGSFCGHYPADQDIWPRIKPSRALPHHLREVLLPRLGSVLASHDRSRNRSATRLGIALRPFQVGDRLSALSFQHLVRAGELMSRIDDAQGQATARIIVLTDPSLDFRSDDAACTKGQTLLGVAGVIEAIHSRQNHAVKFLFSSRQDLRAQLGAISQRRRSREVLYLLSDFLYGKLESDAQLLEQSGLGPCSFFCVRDPLELPESGNRLLRDALRLIPYDEPGSGAQGVSEGVPEGGRFHFSGADYLARLDDELRRYHRVVENGLGLTVSPLGLFALFSCSSSVHDVVRMVSESDLISNHEQVRARRL